MKRLFASLLLVSVAACPLVLIGCHPNKPGPAAAVSDDEQWLERQRSRGLVEMRPAPIPDVPVAIGFRVVPSKSSVTTDSRGVRTLNFLVQGWSTVADAEHFYRQNTLNYAWQPLASDGGLVFVKGPERLTFQIWRGEDAIINVRVRITPR